MATDRTLVRITISGLYEWNYVNILQSGKHHYVDKRHCKCFGGLFTARALRVQLRTVFVCRENCSVTRYMLSANGNEKETQNCLNWCPTAVYFPDPFVRQHQLMFRGRWFSCPLTEIRRARGWWKILEKNSFLDLSRSFISFESKGNSEKPLVTNMLHFQHDHAYKPMYT